MMKYQNDKHNGRELNLMPQSLERVSPESLDLFLGVGRLGLSPKIGTREACPKIYTGAGNHLITLGSTGIIHPVFFLL
jgi:hypothetical protein